MKDNENKIKEVKETYFFIANECFDGLASSKHRERVIYTAIQYASRELLEIALNKIKTGDKEKDKAIQSILYKEADILSKLLRNIYLNLTSLNSFEVKEKSIRDLLKKHNFDLEGLIWNSIPW